MALHLAAALRRRGHEVVAWAPPPLPPEVRWWQDWLWRRQRLEELLADGPPFDALDLPVIAIGRRVAERAPVVARSIQPMLLYALVDARAALRRLASAPLKSLTALAHLAQIARLALVTLRGWSRATVVLCLGSAEREWMARRLPWTRKRLATYVNTVGREEQGELARLRQARAERTRASGDGLRFLWIGRWAAHKGTARLVRFLRQRLAARPNDSFTLAGLGAGAETALPADLMASGRIGIVPEFERSGLAALLLGHDAGLFTSEAEGWGLSLNEMLEAGLPIFATEVGGVRDLRPYFPRTLLPFPPPLDFDPADCREPDLEPYYAEFNWQAIAERYERDVLARLPRRPGSGAR